MGHYQGRCSEAGPVGTDDSMKAKNIDAPSKKAVQEWSDVAAQLDKGEFMSLDNSGPTRFTTWLTTINPDGLPHVTAVGAVWDNDTFWFQTADRTRKAKNIAHDPRCVMSLTLDGFDVVVEGTAEKVTNPDDVARIAEIYATRGGWPVEPDESGTGITAPFNAPGLGPPPWFIYRLTPQAATSVLGPSNSEGGSTRWTFKRSSLGVVAPASAASERAALVSHVARVAHKKLSPADQRRSGLLSLRLGVSATRERQPASRKVAGVGVEEDLDVRLERRLAVTGVTGAVLLHRFLGVRGLRGHNRARHPSARRGRRRFGLRRRHLFRRRGCSSPDCSLRGRVASVTDRTECWVVEMDALVVLAHRSQTVTRRSRAAPRRSRQLSDHRCPASLRRTTRSSS